MKDPLYRHLEEISRTITRLADRVKRLEKMPYSGISGHLILDEMVHLTVRSNLNFTGGGVVATDNAVTGATDVTIPGGGVPSAHATAHENGGTDEISVAGLSGVLADAQTPTAHTHVEADITDLTHTDVTAIHDNVAGEISAIAEKATPIAGDWLVIEDSALADIKKKVQVGNLPYEASGAIAIHAALQTGVHGISITAGKTLTVQNSLTLSGTDAAALTLTTSLTNNGAAGTLTWSGAYALTIPETGTAALLAAANAFTGQNTITNSTYPPLRVIRTSAATNTINGALAIRHQSTAAMVDGFGVGLGFEAYDDSGVNNNLGTIAAVRAGADNTGDLVFRPTLAGTGEERMRINSAGVVIIGTPAADSFMTGRGLTIHQTGYANILTLQSDTLTNPFSTLADDDTYCTFSLVSSTAGGLKLIGYSETTVGMLLIGAGNTEVNTRTTAASAMIDLRAWLEDGAGGATTLTSGYNLMVLRNYTTTEFIFQSDGSAFANVVWDDGYDKYDDVALLESIQRNFDPVAREFGKFARYSRQELEDANLIYYNKDGPGGMINLTRMAMLHTGAIRQLSARLERAERALLKAGINPEELDSGDDPS